MRLGLVGQLNGPIGLLLRIDLEEAAFLEAAALAIVNPFDRKLHIVGAHWNRAGPLSALVVIEGVDIIKPGPEPILYQESTGLAIDVPPAFASPPLLILVTDGNANPAGGAVAQFKIGMSKSRQSKAYAE